MMIVRLQSSKSSLHPGNLGKFGGAVSVHKLAAYLAAYCGIGTNDGDEGLFKLVLNRIRCVFQNKKLRSRHCHSNRFAFERNLPHQPLIFYKTLNIAGGRICYLFRF
jgi:hypothetical protein